MFRHNFKTSIDVVTYFKTKYETEKTNEKKNGKVGLEGFLLNLKNEILILGYNTIDVDGKSAEKIIEADLLEMPFYKKWKAGHEKKPTLFSPASYQNSPPITTESDCDEEEEDKCCKGCWPF